MFSTMSAENRMSARSCARKYAHKHITRTETYGDKSFSCAALRLWNSLPDSVKLCSTVDDFKAKLKTHLFKIAFDQF